MMGPRAKARDLTWRAPRRYAIPAILAVTAALVLRRRAVADRVQPRRPIPDREPGVPRPHVTPDEPPGPGPEPRVIDSAAGRLRPKGRFVPGLIDLHVICSGHFDVDADSVAAVFGPSAKPRAPGGELSHCHLEVIADEAHTVVGFLSTVGHRGVHTELARASVEDQPLGGVVGRAGSGLVAGAGISHEWPPEHVFEERSRCGGVAGVDQGVDRDDHSDRLGGQDRLCPGLAHLPGGHLSRPGLHRRLHGVGRVRHPHSDRAERDLRRGHGPALAIDPRFAPWFGRTAHDDGCRPWAATSPSAPGHADHAAVPARLAHCTWPGTASWPDATLAPSAFRVGAERPPPPSKSARTWPEAATPDHQAVYANDRM